VRSLIPPSIILGNAFYGKSLRIQGYNAELSVASGRLWESGLPSTLKAATMQLAQAVLRAVRINGDWDDYRCFHRRQQHQHLYGVPSFVVPLAEEIVLEQAA